MRTRPELIKNHRVGLLVGEMQMLHKGHYDAIATMRAGCERGYVALGSSDKFGIHGHPFPFEARRDMVKGLFPDVEVVSLQDIDASAGYEAWMKYVLKRLADEGLEPPTDYYTGSDIDARWYENYFASTKSDGRQTGLVTTYEQEHDGHLRRLHVVDRFQSGLPSGRDLRFLVEMRDPEWKRYVPARLWNYIEWHYPPRLRQPMTYAGVPNWDLDLPTHTRLLDVDTGLVHELKDDGVWRPLRDEPDEKADAARRMHEQASVTR